MRVDSEGRKLSEAQQEFFKDSKVRDEEGRLLTVYHGSDKEFFVFDRTKARANMDIQGSFFSPWEIDAQGYGGKVGEYYLNIVNPASEAMGYKALKKFQGQNGAGIKAREYLQSLGYDGVNNGGEEYIAFESNQIKSVTNQTPTENPDIRYSKRRGNFSKALTSDEWKKYNNAMTSKMDAGLRINDHAMLVESEKGDYSYKLVIYDNTLPDNPISAVYAIVARQDPNAKRNFYERDVAEFITKAEDKYDNGRVLQELYKTYVQNYGYVFGRYNPKDGKVRFYGRAVQSSTENIRQESVGRGVSERVGEAGSISDLGKVQYQLRIEDKNRLDILDKQETRLTADLKTLEKAYAEAIRAEYERSIKPSEETSRRAAEINRKAAKRKPTKQKREPPELPPIEQTVQKRLPKVGN